MRRQPYRHACRMCADEKRIHEFPLCAPHRAEHEAAQAAERARVDAETRAKLEELRRDPAVVAREEMMAGVACKAPASWSTR